jgi:molybdate transport system substrate-binding protein
MNRIALAVLAGVTFAGGCTRGGAQAPVLVYCGSSMRTPMEEIGKLYEKKHGRRIDLSFGDSGTLVIQAEQRKAGDAFVVHDPFGAMAENRGLVESTTPVALLVPSIGVKIGTKGELEVKRLGDLAKPGLKLGIPDAQYSTCGNVLAAMLKKASLDEAVMKNASLTSRSSGDLVNALSLGSVDAIVAWDALIRRDATLKLIPIEPEYQLDAVTSATGKTYQVRNIYITISVLKSAMDASAARKLVELAAGPEGQAVFTRHGFATLSEIPAQPSP